MHLGNGEDLTANTDSQGYVQLTGVNSGVTGLLVTPQDAVTIICRPEQTGATTWKVRCFRRDSANLVQAVVSTQVRFLWVEVLV